VTSHPVKVAVNHFGMRIMTGFTINQYHIDFIYGLGEEMLAGRKRRLFQFVFQENKIRT
jgi:hypothetical protein